jgi:hypothetical protein
MAQKKAKKKIKEPDLTPAKDVEGGRHRHGHGFGSLFNDKDEPGRTPPGGGPLTRIQ